MIQTLSCFHNLAVGVGESFNTKNAYTFGWKSYILTQGCALEEHGYHRQQTFAFGWIFFFL